MNLISKDVLQGQSAETAKAQRDMADLSERYEALCGQASRWHHQLQMALVQCSDFSRTVNDLLLWLESMETQMRLLEPIDMESSRESLMATYLKLKDLRDELETNQPRVMSLRDTATELLGSIEGSSAAFQAKENLDMIGDRLGSLLQCVLDYMGQIEGRLNIKRDPSPPPYTAIRPSEADLMTRGHGSPLLASHQRLLTRQAALGLGPDAEDGDDDLDYYSGDVVTGRRRRAAFLARVFRTALPIQLLMLLLLGAASLVPMTEEDFSCVLANNFQRSLDPMLRYTNGPPPF